MRRMAGQCVVNGGAVKQSPPALLILTVRFLTAPSAFQVFWRTAAAQTVRRADGVIDQDPSRCAGAVAWKTSCGSWVDPQDRFDGSHRRRYGFCSPPSSSDAAVGGLLGGLELRSSASISLSRTARAVRRQADLKVRVMRLELADERLARLVARPAETTSVGAMPAR